ncbi:MAG TPA: hypothetical protein VF055_01850, partial [Steroidobacteraceae bacterium]
MAAATLLLGPSPGETSVARTPTGGGGAVVLEPVPARESPRTWRRVVFTCTSPGLVEFSDRPCGPLPVLHEVKLHAPAPGAVASGAPATVVPPAPAASTRPAAANLSEDGRASEAERREQIVATGYLALARRFGGDRMGEHHLTLEDTIDNLGRTVLGS